MLKPIVIGLCGFKGSGKDTAADIIIENHIAATKTAVANKLKDFCVEVFGLTREQLDDPIIKNQPLDQPILLDRRHIDAICKLSGYETPEKLYKLEFLLDTPRKVAQIVGTEVMRSLDPDIHCKFVQIRNDMMNLITDIRFNNELTFFQNDPNIRFYSIYIDRASANNSGDEHGSEREIPQLKWKCDYVLYNNTSLGQLKETVILTKEDIYFKANL